MPALAALLLSGTADFLINESCVKLKGGVVNPNPDAPLWERCERVQENQYTWCPTGEGVNSPNCDTAPEGALSKSFASAYPADCSKVSGWTKRTVNGGATFPNSPGEANVPVLVQTMFGCSAQSTTQGASSASRHTVSKMVDGPYSDATDAQAQAKLDVKALTMSQANFAYGPQASSLVKSIVEAGAKVEVDTELQAKTTTPTVQGPTTTTTNSNGTTSTTSTSYSTACTGSSCNVTTNTQVTVTNTTTGDVISQSGTVAEPTPDDCKSNPESVGCAKLGTPGTDAPVWKEKTVVFEPEDLGGLSGCPAPEDWVLPMSGFHLAWSYQPACDVAPIIRAGILLLTALGCSLWIMGTVKT